MFEVNIWLIIGGFAAFIVAWINGANNAANAIGTAVGSKALNIKQALYLAAAFDFLGAMLFGKFVSMTLLKGIVDTSYFNDASIVVYGMTAALFATGLWVIVATIFKIPMSISQAIVGGVMGFGLATLGVSGVNWDKIIQIIIAWLILPFMGAGIALLFYFFIYKKLTSLERKELVYAGDFFLFIMVFTTVFLLNVKTLKSSDLAWALTTSIAVSLVFLLPFHVIVYKTMPKDIEAARKHIFRILLIVSAASMAFSHGANDVANSAGPLAGILYAVTKGVVPQNVTIPLEALTLSATGIALGILIWGYQVVETIGEKITVLSIETAFMAQFAGSIAVLIVTRLGLPVSTTVSIVGAVAGIGFAKGIKAVNIKTLVKIVSAWFLAFPIVAGLAMIFYYLLSFIPF